jgi:hypothetical protein
MENLIISTVLGYVVIFCTLIALIFWLILDVIFPYLCNGTIYIKNWIDFNRNRKAFEEWRKTKVYSDYWLKQAFGCLNEIMESDIYFENEFLKDKIYFLYYFLDYMVKGIDPEINPKIK